ncbi:hypothetical protein [Pigmentibacter ruber]|uniref:hypothetical protein n=1 Tax=Pigmentibacter ruber TaxID=2683196 RepID=UPI00131D7E10|nr:hypothetical protein [Pigmentibacter ruber]
MQVFNLTSKVISNNLVLWRIESANYIGNQKINSLQGTSSFQNVKDEIIEAFEDDPRFPCGSMLCENGSPFYTKVSYPCYNLEISELNNSFRWIITASDYLGTPKTPALQNSSPTREQAEIDSKHSFNNDPRFPPGSHLMKNKEKFCNKP